MSEFVYGLHTVQAILDRDPSRFRQVYVPKEHVNKRVLVLINKLKILGINVQFIKRKWLNRQTGNAVHQGVIAHVKLGPKYQEKDLDLIINRSKSPFLLILDGITDSHNLGACLRNADAAGVDAVIVPKHNSAPLNAIAKKVACGAAENMPVIRITNISQKLRQLKQQYIRIIGTSISITRDDNKYLSLYESNLTGAVALVMGAEGKGMRKLTRNNCDELISIPMSGSVLSLNVSVATGVCLFEAVRQRCTYKKIDIL